MTSQERRQLISQGFRRIFGGEPAVWVRAPGRVDLMGSHTDHNMGYVMAMTIDRDAWIAARPRPDRRVTVHSLNLDGGISSNGGPPHPPPVALTQQFPRGRSMQLPPPKQQGQVDTGIRAHYSVARRCPATRVAREPR